MTHDEEEKALLKIIYNKALSNQNLALVLMFKIKCHVTAFS